jgi:hypothetical protein
MPEASKKRHHQVPQFYLQRFSSATGQVWNYDKQGGRVWPRSVEDTAFERHLYSITMEDGQYNTEIDDFITKVENIGAPLVDRVMAGEHLSGQNRYDFASFVAIMFVRTNSFRRLFAETLGNTRLIRNRFIASNDDLFDAEIERFQAKCGQITDERKQALRKNMLDPSKYTLVVDREYTLKALQYHDELAPLLAAMEWTILDIQAGASFFITSDNPVIKWVHPRYHHPLRGSGGFKNKHVEVLFPLSPARCWVGHWIQGFPRSSTTTATRVKQTNRLIAREAEKFLYSHVENSKILQLAKKHANSQRTIKVGWPGKINPEIKVVRSLARATNLRGKKSTQS